MESDGVPLHLRVVTGRILKQGEESSENVISTDSTQLSTLKGALRTDEALITSYVRHLYRCLESSTSEKRQVVLSLFDYFFAKSHHFRSCTIERLEDMLRLSCETDPLHHPLPPSKEGAKTLKVFAIKIIKKWHERFGVGYDKLQNVNAYLQLSKSIDYNQASSEMMAERRRKEEQLRKQEERAVKVAQLIGIKLANSKQDIERCLLEVDTAVKLLVPLLTDETENSSGNSSKEDNSESVVLHGYEPHDTISVVLKSIDPVVDITEDNEDVVQIVRDGRIMLDVYKNTIVKWLQKLTKCGATQNILKELITIKQRIENSCSKIDELKLQRVKQKNHGDLSSDDDSDLEDVPEKQLEDFRAPYEVPKYIMDKISRDSNQPCCSKTLSQEIADGSPLTPLSSSTSVPTVSFGLDLKYWGDDKRGHIDAPKNDSDCHSFWRAPDEVQASTSKEPSVYETRVFTFVGDMKRPTKQCRARLTTGKLCPRMDVNKCPIHGTIVDRDLEGFPVAELSASTVDAVAASVERDEADYLRDLEAATGMSLTGGSPKKKKLTEVAAGREVRERLEKKLLDKRTVKRVSEVLDAVRKAKIQKKFGSQFAHSLSR